MPKPARTVLKQKPGTRIARMKQIFTFFIHANLFNPRPKMSKDLSGADHELDLGCSVFSSSILPLCKNFCVMMALIASLFLTDGCNCKTILKIRIA